MSMRAKGAVLALVIGPVGLATWILATYTVGQSLDERNSMLIGFSIALLAVATGTSLLFLGPLHEPPGSHLGRILILCGTACVFIALALQFYLAGIVAQNFQHVANLLLERGGNVNLNANFPNSIGAISYFAFLAGIWLAAIGIRVDLTSEDRTRAAINAPSAKPEVGA